MSKCRPCKQIQQTKLNLNRKVDSQYRSAALASNPKGYQWLGGHRCIRHPLICNMRGSTSTKTMTFMNGGIRPHSLVTEESWALNQDLDTGDPSSISWINIAPLSLPHTNKYWCKNWNRQKVGLKFRNVILKPTISSTLFSNLDNW